MSHWTRRTSTLLAVVLALASPSLAQSMRSAPVTSFAEEPRDAPGWLERARDLWHTQRDYNAARRAFNRAVDAAPDDPTVRNERAFFFDQMSDIVRAEDKEKFRERAKQDYTWVAEHAPDMIVGGVARDSLTRLSGTILVPQKAASCPEGAAQSYGRAESLFAVHRLAEAIAEYETATAGCPDAAMYWVNFADAYYNLKQYGKAKQLFERALVADPWQRAGHRFLADTESQLGNMDAALHQAALAVVSDPIYETGWASLRDFASATRRSWNRVYAAKATGSSAATSGKEGEVASDDTCWAAYGVGKTSISRSDLDPRTMSALEIERRGVRMALDLVKRRDASAAPFWSMMARAKKAGFLDEAIFLHMLDAPLAAEYPAFREKNGARLAEYLETVVVPKK